MTLFLVRHAHAGTRDDSGHTDDSLRNLSEQGRHQAAAIAGTLQEMGAAAVIASPFRRCVETAAPLAALLNVTLEISDALAEGAHLPALAMIREIGLSNAALISHGDIIPALLSELASAGEIDLGPTPRCQKASIWMLEADPNSPRVFVSATYVPPPRWRML